MRAIFLMQNINEAVYPGLVIDGKYQLIEVLWRSEKSSVYRACQLKLDWIVAVKVFNEFLEDEIMARFENYAAQKAEIKHENLLAIYDFGSLPNRQPYIVMQYVEAGTLAKVLKEKNLLEPELARMIFLQLARALGTLHENGLLHGDISPENVFLEEVADGNYQTYLSSFSLRRAIENDGSNGPVPGAAYFRSGTPAYMSCEQCTDGEMDSRSDLYSLAALMYRTLLGHVPFEAENDLLVMQKHVKEEAYMSSSERARIGEKLADLIMRCLAKDPDARIQSALLLEKELAECKIEQEGEREIETRTSPLFSRLQISIMGAALLVGLFLVAFVLPGLFNNSAETGNAGAGMLASKNLQSLNPDRAVNLALEREIKECDLLFQRQSAAAPEKVRTLELRIKDLIKNAASKEEQQALNCQLIHLLLLKSRASITIYEHPEEGKELLKVADCMISGIKPEPPGLRSEYLFQLALLEEKDESRLAAAMDNYLLYSKPFWRSKAAEFTGMDRIVSACIALKKYSLASKYVPAVASIYAGQPLGNEVSVRVLKIKLQSAFLDAKLGHIASSKKKLLELEKIVSMHFNDLFIVRLLDEQVNLMLHLHELQFAEYFQELMVKATQPEFARDHELYRQALKRLANLYQLNHKPAKAKDCFEKIRRAS